MTSLAERVVRPVVHLGSPHCCECAGICYHIGPMLLCAEHKRPAATIKIPFSMSSQFCQTTGQAIGMCRDRCCRPDLHPSNTIWIEVNA